MSMFNFSRKSPEEKVVADINKGPDRAERKEIDEEKKTLRESFDLDTALDDPKFVEFLAKFPDEGGEGMDMSESNPKLVEYFLMYKEKESLSKSMTEIFASQVQMESGVDVKDDMDSVDDYLATLAIESSDTFNQLAASRKLMEKSIAELKKTEAEVQEILNGETKEEIEESYEDLKYANQIGFFQRIFDSKARKERKDILEEYGISKKDLKEAMNTEGQKLATLEQIQQIQEVVLRNFLTAERLILSKEILPLQNARQKALEKIMDELAISTTKPEGEQDISEINKVSQKIRKVKESGNYVPEYEENLAVLEEYLAEATQKILHKKLEEAVSELNSNKISTLEKSLNGIINKMSSDGLNTAENKQLILNKLEELKKAEVLKNTKEGKAKALLISRIIIKFKK